MRVSVCRVQSTSQCLKCGHAGVPVELSSLSSTKIHPVSKKNWSYRAVLDHPEMLRPQLDRRNKGHTLGLCYVNVDTLREKEVNR